MTTTKTLPMAEFLASRPAWAKSALFAEHEIDNCDLYTDYFSTKVTRRVFLAWSAHTRDLFSEMRKAAGLFSETAHLVTAPKSAEHREKWSMGSGYYLKAAGRYSTGWNVSKTNFFGHAATIEVVDAPAPTTVAAPSAPVAVGDGVTMALNAARGGVEIKFASKPERSVLDTLKANGWRWSRFNSVWYRKDTPDARAFAAALVGDVAVAA